MILLFTEASEKFGLPISLKREYELYITNCELMRIAEIMGQDFYDDVEASPSSYTTLIPYIKDCSLYWSYDMYLRQGTSKNSVMGSVTINSDYSSHDTKERQYKIDNNLEVAHFYERKLWDFLTENADDYPLWTENSNKTILPKFSLNIGDRDNVNY